MIGTTLGAYRIDEAIGRGGMGMVYRATDVRLGRTVAIKVLPPSTEAAPRSAEQVQRFLKEAKAASALSHPHIVTLHDIGREGDVDFIVMEYVAGRTLAEMIATGPLAVPRAVGIARQIADALAAAHRAGIVHRDLKPANVIVGDDGRARVLDFGLARMEAAGAGGTEALTVSLGLTEPGTVVGTPAYMAPEQVKGATADARSDVHAVGVVLYEMLAGSRPFESSSYATVVHAIAYEDPEPIARRRPGVPRAVVRVIERCMRKEPSERYADGGALHAALEPVARALESGSAVKEGLGTFTSDIAHSGRHALKTHRRSILTAAVVLAIAGTAALAWTFIPALRTGVSQRFARLPAAARTPFELYKSGLADLDRYFEPGRVDRAVATFQQAVTADPNYAPGYAGLAEAYWRRYRDNRDEAWLRQAVGTARQSTALDPQLARGHVALGLALAEGRSFDEARRAFEQALRLDPHNAQAHRGLGAVAMAANQPADADSEFTRAIALAPGDWEIRSQRGVLHLTYGRYEEALADFEATVKMSPDNPYTWRNVGGAQHMLGRFADAAASFQKSIEIKPDPVVYSNLGTIYFFQGLYSQAVSAFEKSVQLGPNHATIWRNLGDAYRRVPGRDPDAAQAYLRSAQLLREELKQQPGDVVLTSELALCLARRGEVTEARTLARSVDAGARTVAEAGYALVLAYEAMGARDDALAMLRDALAAGYPREEIQGDPELIALRRDSRYHRLLATLP